MRIFPIHDLRIFAAPWGAQRGRRPPGQRLVSNAPGKFWRLFRRGDGLSKEGVPSVTVHKTQARSRFAKRKTEVYISRVGSDGGGSPAAGGCLSGSRTGAGGEGCVSGGSGTGSGCEGSGTIGSSGPTGAGSGSPGCGKGSFGCGGSVFGLRLINLPVCAFIFGVDFHPSSLFLCTSAATKRIMR